MNFIKRLTVWLLILQMAALPVAATARAEGPGFQGDTSRFEGATQLLERFIGYAKQVPVTGEAADGSVPDQTIAQVYQELAQKIDVQQGIALQIVKLPAGDFNLFLLYLIYRYAETKDAKTRAILLLFRDEVQAQIKGELDNTALIEKGPFESIPMDSIYKSTTLLALWAAFEGAKFVFTRGRSLSGGQFLKRLEVTGKKLTRVQKVVRFGKDAFRNPLVWSTAAGVAWSTASYYQQAFSEQKLSPKDLFQIAQAEMACNFQFQEFGLSTRYDEIAADKSKAATLAPALLADYDMLLADVDEVRKGFEETNYLDTRDPHYQQNLSLLPKQEDWNRLRQDIAAQQKARQGECLQISMDRLFKVLKGTKSALEEILNEAVPGAVTSTFSDEGVLP